jgi:hypothetical protein
MKIKVVHDQDWKSLRRQSFGGNQKAQEFSFGFDFTEYDGLLSFGQEALLSQIKNSVVPRHRRFCLLMENPAFFTPSTDYLSEHGFVICPFDISVPSGVSLIKAHAANQWFYDISYDINAGLEHRYLSHDQQKNLEFYSEEIFPHKKKLLSVITSTKGFHLGHKIRLNLTVQLKNKFGAEVDLFGFGHNPIYNKREALENYQHTLVVENDFSDYFVTEKLTDALLGFCNPIYIGAFKINEIYQARINSIDFRGKSIDNMVDEVVRVVEKGFDKDSVLAARYETLFVHNFYYHMARIIRGIID